MEQIEIGLGPIVASSSFYETEPWGEKDQAPFINIALKVETYLSPTILLKEINKIEFSLGRIRDKKWSSREIDIDIISYGDTIMHSDQLTIPHKWMSKRNFVLLPLQELEPTWIHPESGETIQELIDKCDDDEAVQRLQLNLN